MPSHSTMRRSLLKFAGLLAAAGTGAGRIALAATGKISARTSDLKAFKGQLVERHDPAYLGWFWAMTWYRSKPERFPTLLAQPRDHDDLALLMAHAKRTSKRVVTRSSGHNISMPCLQSDAITIDMSLFDSIDVNVADRSVWAGPGVFSEQLNRELYAKGFSFPSAHTGFVSIGGFLLGGGMGWNMPNWGMACGSILAAEVMLADGKILPVSENENADLYWALRGVGPGFFAIVLRYKLRIYATPKILKNAYFFPLDKVDAAITECLRLLPQSANRSELLGAIGKFNPPSTPADKQTWNWALSIMSYGESEAEAKAAADLFAQSKLPSLATAQAAKDVPLTYLDLYTQLSTDGFSEFRTSEVALFTDEPAKAIAIVADTLSKRAVDARSFGFSVLGTNPTVPEPCSFTYSAPHYLSWYLMGTTNADVAANAKLMGELHDALKPYIKGYYINEVDLNQFPTIAHQCFSQEKWSKLQAVCKRYDPERRFVSYLDSAK